MDNLLNNVANHAPLMVALIGAAHCLQNELVHRLQFQKVGGMRFFKFRYYGPHKICISWCITQK